MWRSERTIRRAHLPRPFRQIRKRARMGADLGANVLTGSGPQHAGTRPHLNRQSPLGKGARDGMSSRSWFLCAVLCADTTVHTGVTTDLARRLRQHNAGRGARYTAARRPVDLIGAWAFGDRGEAQSAEAQFRRMTRRAKLQRTARRLPVAGSAFAMEAAVREHLTVTRFCPQCGEVLRRIKRSGDDRSRLVCTACGRIDYRNAKPCAGVLVMKHGHVLLIRRSMDPFQGWWDIPGGFLEIDELPSEAAMREVEEETGLTVTLTDLLGFYLGRYASGDFARPTLNIGFIGTVAGGEEQPGNETTELAWFGADELPDRLAFDHTRGVFQDWRDWLACTANGQESVGE